MTLQYDENNRRWSTTVGEDIFNGPNAVQVQPLTKPLLSPERAYQEAQLQETAQSQGGGRRPWDQKPWLHDDLGSAAAEATGATANALTGVVTDWMDLFAMVGDVARASTGNMAWDEVGNDADNPWTRKRREMFYSTSKAGQVISPMLRIGAHFIGGGFIKSGIKAAITGAATRSIPGAAQIGKAAQAYSRWGATGFEAADTAGDARKLLNAVNASDDYIRRSALGLVQRGAKDPFKIRGKGIPLTGALRTHADRLTATIGAQFNLSKPIPALKSLGELVLYDAFVDFMVSSPNEEGFEDTLGDWMSGLDNQLVAGLGSLTATDPLENAMQHRAKNALEGSVLNLLAGPIVDSFRVASMARQFGKLDAEDKAKVLGRLGKPEDYADLTADRVKKSAQQAGEEAVPAAPPAQEAVQPTPQSSKKQVAELEQLRNQQQAQREMERYENQVRQNAARMREAALGEQDVQAPEVQRVDTNMNVPSSLRPEPSLGGQWQNPLAGPNPNAPQLPTDALALRRLPSVAASPNRIREVAVEDITELMNKPVNMQDARKVEEWNAELTQAITSMVPNDSIGAVQYLQSQKALISPQGGAHAVDGRWLNYLYEVLLEGKALDVSDDFRPRTIMARAERLDQGRIQGDIAKVRSEKARLQEPSEAITPEVVPEGEVTGLETPPNTPLADAFQQANDQIAMEGMQAAGRAVEGIGRIRQILDELAAESPGGRVRIADVRKRLPDVPKEELDQVLQQMDRGKEAQLMGMERPGRHHPGGRRSCSQHCRPASAAGLPKTWRWHCSGHGQ